MSNQHSTYFKLYAIELYITLLPKIHMCVNYDFIKLIRM